MKANRHKNLRATSRIQYFELRSPIFVPIQSISKVCDSKFKLFYLPHVNSFGIFILAVVLLAVEWLIDKNNFLFEFFLLSSHLPGSGCRLHALEIFCCYCWWSRIVYTPINDCGINIALRVQKCITIRSIQTVLGKVIACFVLNMAYSWDNRVDFVVRYMYGEYFVWFNR